MKDFIIGIGEGVFGIGPPLAFEKTSGVSKSGLYRKCRTCFLRV